MFKVTNGCFGSLCQSLCYRINVLVKPNRYMLRYSYDFRSSKLLNLRWFGETTSKTFICRQVSFFIITGIQFWYSLQISTHIWHSIDFDEITRSKMLSFKFFLQSTSIILKCVLEISGKVLYVYTELYIFKHLYHSTIWLASQLKKHSCISWWHYLL